MKLKQITKTLISRWKIWWYEPPEPVMESHGCKDHRVIEQEYGNSNNVNYIRFVTSCSVCNKILNISPWFLENEIKTR